MGSSVGDDLVIEAKAEVHFVEKECSDAFSGDVFLCGTENHPLSKPMVDHDQKGIKTGRRREVGDKITRDLLEGVGRGGANGGEWRDGGVGISLILLAGCTAFNVFADVGGKAGPPEFCGDKLAGFQVAGVTGTFMVMASLENSVAEGIVIGDIDAALIDQDACFDLPVGEAGTEGERDIIVHGLKGLENKGIACRSRLDAMGKGDVDNIDEERRGEESDSIVVIIRLGKEVRTMREGIRAGEEFSWDMDHFQVKVRKVDEPTGLSLVEVLGGAKVGEILMVGEDLDWEGGSVKVVLPCFQGSDDSKEFSVIDVVVSFRWGEQLGKVGTWMPFAI